MRIAIITDKFFPSVGGIENHTYNLAKEFMKSKHYVIVITHSYGKKYKGEKIIDNIPIYYLEIPIIYDNYTFPLLFTSAFVYYKIFKNNKIEIIHGHQTISVMSLEGIFIGSILGIRTFLTEHSIFELNKIEIILLTIIIKFYLIYLDMAIGVSKIGKDNLQERLSISDDRIKIIPNGIDRKIFYPIKKIFSENRIRVIICSRLMFRKGIDLVLDVIPLICMNKNIEIKIIGDGPYKSDITEIIDIYRLQEQVKMLGNIEYKKIGDFMREADILLNLSLTESFCMVVLEGLCCGLKVVTTNVGGICELKNNKNIYYCLPERDDIYSQFFNAINDLKKEKKVNKKFIKKQRIKYSWKRISKKLIYYYRQSRLKDSRFQSFLQHINFNLIIIAIHEFYISSMIVYFLSKLF